MFTSCKKSNNPVSSGDETATVTYAGKVYHTVKIGNQTWLKENLNVGVMIDSTQNPSNNGTIEKYCYRNDTANCTKYGGLYQWNEAMVYDTANGAKGICPTGWHIPTQAEFETLTATVNNDGNSLKTIDQGASTDLSGFSGLLAGYFIGGNYFNLGSYTTFWSSTEINAAVAYSVSLRYNYSNIYMVNLLKECGYSIRCIKD
ncbi:MAG: FISUMP domain-containing protein [Ignavibacteria bacterium]|nr:FISUMP domain-containing protein [Ignavibacteria bacterium]